MNADFELALLRELEKKARTMFEFSGWADDVDPDAALAVDQVDRMLDVIENLRRLMPGNEPKSPLQVPAGHPKSE